MSNKSFTFVEKTDQGKDNGYDSISGFLRIGEVNVGSVEEMVDHILENLGDDDCIEEITIIGHGAPGYISVGNGQCVLDNGKAIGLNNRRFWVPQLRRIRCRFCKDSEIYLRGCNVGANVQGARLLFQINQVVQCAAAVEAPTGVCNPLFTTGKDQTSSAGEIQPPNAIPNPDQKEKKKKKSKFLKGNIVNLRAGVSLDNLAVFEAADIVAAQYLSAEVTDLFEVETLQVPPACLVPPDLLSTLVVELEDAEPRYFPQSGFAIEALLQFQVIQDGEVHCLPPWSIMGGGAYASVFRGDTSLSYLLPQAVFHALEQLHKSVLDDLTKRSGSKGSLA